MAHRIIEKSVHSATRKRLQGIKGFSEVKVDKIKEALNKAQVQSSGMLWAA